MPDSSPSKKSFSITRDSRISAQTTLPSLGTIFSALAIAFLVYAFFSGLSFQFYASFVFFFYSITHSMWTSVVLLGVFQTLLMIPFRIIRIIQSNNVKEFQRTVDRLEDQKKQGFVLKKRFREGNSTFLFYSVDFVWQLVSYISLGRLFLTDFYTQKLQPHLLYDWVAYPEYPIRDTFFKIPYVAVNNTTDWGWHVVLLVWLVLLVIQIGILVARRSVRNKHGDEVANSMFSGRWAQYATGSLLFFMLLAYLLIRHFPTGWEFRIFSGDVSVQNTTFNAVTAIATFITLLWHGIPRIVRKGRLAEKLGVPTGVIEMTQMDMLKETIFTATLVGLGAFFITNQIPSAFELSIFTLEVISLISPFTLDRIVLKSLAVVKDEENTADVLHEFGQEEKLEEDLAQEVSSPKPEETTPSAPTEARNESSSAN